MVTAGELQAGRDSCAAGGKAYAHGLRDGFHCHAAGFGGEGVFNIQPGEHAAGGLQGRHVFFAIGFDVIFN